MCLRYIRFQTPNTLWAGLATQEEAQSIVERLLPLLEVRGGVAASDEASRGEVSEDRPLRQWDFPFAWAPHQMLIWDGLERYGFHDIAQRLMYKWLFMIMMDSLRNGGRVAEKYDGVEATAERKAEYGNEGNDIGLAQGGQGFLWSNASFLVGFERLDANYQAALRKGIPPEMVFRASEDRLVTAA